MKFRKTGELEAIRRAEQAWLMASAYCLFVVATRSASLSTVM